MKQKIHLLYLKDELIFFYEKFISLKLVSSKTKFYDEFRKSVNVDDRTDFVVILSIWAPNMKLPISSQGHIKYCLMPQLGVCSCFNGILRQNYILECVLNQSFYIFILFRSCLSWPSFDWQIYIEHRINCSHLCKQCRYKISHIFLTEQWNRMNIFVIDWKQICLSVYVLFIFILLVEDIFNVYFILSQFVFE